MISLRDGFSSESDDSEEFNRMDLQPITRSRVCVGRSRHNTSWIRHTASKVGCKSQQYTSWDCLSRSYVGGVGITTDEVIRTKRSTPSVELEGDTPTEKELEEMTPLNIRLVKEKKKYFVRGLGAVSRKKLLKVMEDREIRKNVHQQEAILSVSSDSGFKVSPGKRSISDDDHNLGYYYSNVLPVRCVGITSFVTKRESDMSIPYSPIYQALANRLNDPAQTGDFISI